jgi:hypothetical protein
MKRALNLVEARLAAALGDFHIDYGAAAPKYVDKFMENVAWTEVDRRNAAGLRAIA